MKLVENVLKKIEKLEDDWDQPIGQIEDIYGEKLANVLYDMIDEDPSAVDFILKRLLDHKLLDMIKKLK